MDKYQKHHVRKRQTYKNKQKTEQCAILFYMKFQNSKNLGTQNNYSGCWAGSMRSRFSANEHL